MRELVLTDGQHKQLLQALLSDHREAFAVLFCGCSATDTRERLLTREVWAAPDSAYRIRQRDRLEIASPYVNDVVTHALATGLHPVLVHSHPGNDPAFFSLADDAGDRRLLAVLAQLLPGRIVASGVLTANDMIVRSLSQPSMSHDARDVRDTAGHSGPNEAHECREFREFDGVRKIGPLFRRIGARGAAAYDTFDACDARLLDRQLRALGATAQGHLTRLRVAVIGAGGTGSATLEQLVRSGILDILLVDPDRFEPSNWGRVWGSQAAHADLPEGERPLKVDVQVEHLLRIRPDVRLRTIVDSVVNETVLRELRDRDVVFCCTDNHLSRAVLNRLAHQHLVPVIDMGIRVDARCGVATAASGRVSLVGPGLACLRCGNHLDTERVRAESMPAAERSRLARDGYVIGLAEAVPSVVSLNTTVASLAVTACLSMFAGLTGGVPPVTQIYDATTSQLFTVEPRHDEGCEVCAADGVFALGDAQRVSAYDTHRLE